MQQILYTLAVEAAGLLSKFSNSQYKKGNNLIPTNVKKEAEDCTIYNIHQIKANQWLRKNMSILWTYRQEFPWTFSYTDHFVLHKEHCLQQHP